MQSAASMGNKPASRQSLPKEMAQSPRAIRQERSRAPVDDRRHHKGERAARQLRRVISGIAMLPRFSTVAEIQRFLEGGR